MLNCNTHPVSIKQALPYFVGHKSPGARHPQSGEKKRILNRAIGDEVNLSAEQFLKELSKIEVPIGISGRAIRKLDDEVVIARLFKRLRDRRTEQL